LLNGSLFTRDFLSEGIRQTAAWTALDETAVAAVQPRLTTLFAAIGRAALDPNVWSGRASQEVRDLLTSHRSNSAGVAAMPQDC
jgi:hypothetical protein